MAGVPHDAWVLVADGEKALIMRNEGDEDYPNFEVMREEEQENPPNREIKANRAGRFNDGPSVHRSKVEDTDWHQLNKERFASDLADLLYKFAHGDKFDRLVIAAAPEILGELRKEMHQEVSERVISEIPKTLTNHPLDEIERIVAAEG